VRKLKELDVKKKAAQEVHGAQQDEQDQLLLEDGPVGRRRSESCRSEDDFKDSGYLEKSEIKDSNSLDT
jgi:vacuolar-type H+-ATPase subunit I/STV1